MKEFGEGSRSIGIFELSELFGITPEALRKYEEKHILHPIRDKNGYRKYSSWDLTKLVRIRQLRSEGVSLGGVAQQLRQGDPQQKLQELESLKRWQKRSFSATGSSPGWTPSKGIFCRRSIWATAVLSSVVGSSIVASTWSTIPWSPKTVLPWLT